MSVAVPFRTGLDLGTVQKSAIHWGPRQPHSAWPSDSEKEQTSHSQSGEALGTHSADARRRSHDNATTRGTRWAFQATRRPRSEGHLRAEGTGTTFEQASFAPDCAANSTGVQQMVQMVQKSNWAPSRGASTCASLSFPVEQEDPWCALQSRSEDVPSAEKDCYHELPFQSVSYWIAKTLDDAVGQQTMAMEQTA